MNLGCVVLGIKLTCGICGAEKTLDNPLGLSLGMLIWKAETDEIGWYVPGDGKVLCPRHEREAAARYGLASLFAKQPRPRATLPTLQAAAKKQKAPTMEKA